MGLKAIISGKAENDGQPFRGWFIGTVETWAAQANPDGPPLAFGLRNSQTVEIKWDPIPQGQHRPGGWATCTPKTSVSILIQGDFLLQFRDPEHPSDLQEYHLDQPGAYVLWREDVEHTWQAQVDSIILTVRWVEAQE